MNFLRRFQSLDNQLKAVLATVVISVVWLVYAVTTIQPGDAEILANQPQQIAIAQVPPSQMRPSDSRASIQSSVIVPTVPLSASPTVQPVPPQVSRPVRSQPIRSQPAPPASSQPPTSPPAVPAYQPRELVAFADPTNYGERVLKDVYGRSAAHAPIVVLHETVSSANSTISFFQTPHPRDEDQASYHALITQDGTIVYLVSPDKRAFGAGNSVFNGPNGPEAVKTHPKFPPSVNNFAYHISLETPPDGRNNGNRHSGYTAAQYESLSWLVARAAVPESRITTHQAVDRSGSRKDPRSFNQQTFLTLLRAYTRPALTVPTPRS
ncbi:peptidoglycan recognition family protein [Trichocoleus sp. FACHB-262]|uniref:peptidoglycan recognition protein family protein n=1 Tax=Trichocoleus sp. FACHB-262 TaxID=2692869 RepID=UPI001F5553FA|nr:peptidoglycan recognition family protein [Trichocoleus sp. FACHB-262]